MRKNKDQRINLAKIAFVFSLIGFAYIYGFISFPGKLFPYYFIEQAIIGADMVFGEERIPYYYQETDYTTMIPTYDESAAYYGPSLITSVIENDSLSARIIDMDGELIHEWDIDWFEIWPDVRHILKSDPHLPKSRPGTLIHGAVLLDDGDLIFNFDNLGMVRLDACGNVIWRLAYKTHHSIYLDEFDNLWVSGQKYHLSPLPDFPNYKPPITEETVLKVSLEGKILNEISILDVLKENNLQGLLFMSALDNAHIEVSGDLLHLNDVETFPSYMEEGVFKAGDIMVSLRNINTILVFREKDRKVTYMSVGEFIRQHDPDFIDGNTISIYNNNNIASNLGVYQSIILIRSFDDNQSYVYHTGDENQPFYSVILGKHEWLPNGNLLITESMKGRAFEIDQQGKIVWEFVNIVDKEYVGIVEDVHRLSDIYTKDFFDQRIDECRDTFLK